MATVLISLGSNVDPERTLAEAARLLAGRRLLAAVSGIYETAQVGQTNRARFLNAAALVDTDLPAAVLKNDVCLWALRWWTWRRACAPRCDPCAGPAPA